MRGGRCKICHHPERARIEALRASGSTLDALAAKFSVHRDALWRHYKLHVSDATKANLLGGAGTLAQLKERAVEEGGSCLEYLQIVRSRLMLAFSRAADTGLSPISGRLIEVTREIGRLTGEIHELSPGVNVSVGGLSASKMLELNEGLMRIAREHPGARQDILSLLNSIEDRPSGPPNGSGGLLIEGEIAP